MDHAVTIRDLLLVGCIIGGLAAIVAGVVNFFDGANWEAPQGGMSATNKRGLREMIEGAVIIAIAIWGLVH